ncbi:sugar phosphorylase [Aestuariirhabdus sp. Z084]|uniref:sugar phosphorylase n=1 Tax=Aestuariirhabdus haliotis TaxID=2918751 RepID=UPI00201B3BA4|nr:sugar phosphorylase [Aestuariirhabdus haliotis]MCL6417240.1 sugar phosphorylase [Aestuariirhabdus haliotis]MCL6421195.1 sugar phosphorylase [Aestuariirhabdus haliotis]
MSFFSLRGRVQEHLRHIYQDQDRSQLKDFGQRLLDVMELSGEAPFVGQGVEQSSGWSSSDAFLITYGDSLYKEGEKPLHSLRSFLYKELRGVINNVHILPFFPYTSDDGFSVLDFTRVNETLGDWDDIESIASEFSLMSDLVINHTSARSPWFVNFEQGKDPGKDYFICCDPDTDLSRVVRPRASELLRPVETVHGVRYVWCTFSHDQVDLNFANPDVLLEFVRIIRLYLDKGVRVFRLDAIAFLWKEPGTDCLHRPQTHEIVRLLRTLILHAESRALLVTETNVPNRENLSYFGNGNEAHMVYNFPLPPLLLHTFFAGDCHHLTEWLMSMPAPPLGSTYFNFIASHDGIGLRPVEGILDDLERDRMVAMVEQLGGRVSVRKLEGEVIPYELNISLFDALSGNYQGCDQWQLERFICVHTLMMSLMGIPAFYIHSLLATTNDYDRLQHSGNARAINRHRWDMDDLKCLLDNPESPQRQVLDRLKALLAIRQQQPALHPNASQYVLHLGPAVFGVWRQSLSHQQTLFALNNVTDRVQRVNLHSVNLDAVTKWHDLLSGEVIQEQQTSIELQPYQSVWLRHL